MKINTENVKLMTLEDMSNMPIEEIVRLYKDGYRLDESFLNTLQCDCSTPMLGAGLVGFGLGGLLVAALVKRATK